MHEIADMAADALAVLDAAGSERAVVLAETGGGVVGLQLAVDAPERVASLVLASCYARLARADDYRIGLRPELLDAFLRDNPDPDVEWTVDGEDDLDLTAPSMRSDPRFVEWWHRASRRGASPVRARQLLAMTVRADQRSLLPAITQPTLVLHRERMCSYPLDSALPCRAHSGCPVRELPGADHLAFSGDADALLDEIEEFLTGHRHGSADRVLTTVLFTDIVDSTGRAAAIGDGAWRAELDAHDAARAHAARSVRRPRGQHDGRRLRRDLRRAERRHTGRGGDRQGVACCRASHPRRHPHRRVRTPRRRPRRPRRPHRGPCRRGRGRGRGLGSRTVRDALVGSAVTFSSRGEYELKGVPQQWELFAVEAVTVTRQYARLRRGHRSAVRSR